jgi:hypothetical protein
VAVVLSALNQDLENLAFMIHCAPQVHMFAGDPDHNLVEMPSIARSGTHRRRLERSSVRI